MTSTTVERATEIRPFHVEVPEEALAQLFSEEIRAAFRPLRKQGGRHE